jgi:hypothetical protein
MESTVDFPRRSRGGLSTITLNEVTLSPLGSSRSLTVALNLPTNVTEFSLCGRSISLTISTYFWPITVRNIRVIPPVDQNS